MKFDELMKEVLIMANKEGFDVFNALDIMDNQCIFEPLKFAPGDGNLQYYLYNWITSREFKAEDIGIVLV